MNDAPYGQHAAGRITQVLLCLAPAMRQQAWLWCQPTGLTPTQSEILVLLMEQAKPMRLTDIAATIQLTVATTSEAVSTLTHKGLLIKAHSSSDGRTLAIRLTAAGRRTAKKATDWPMFLVNALSTLNAKEQASVEQALDKMLKALRSAGKLYVPDTDPAE